MLKIFLACVGGGILCVAGPESYRFSTVILIETQIIPDDHVIVLIEPSIEERLASIQQQVMSRKLLTQMASATVTHRVPEPVAVSLNGNHAINRSI